MHVLYLYICIRPQRGSLPVSVGTQLSNHSGI